MSEPKLDLLLGALRSLTDAAELASQWPLTIRKQNERRRMLAMAILLARETMEEVS